MILTKIKLAHGDIYPMNRINRNRKKYAREPKVILIFRDPTDCPSISEFRKIAVIGGGGRGNSVRLKDTAPNKNCFALRLKRSNKELQPGNSSRKQGRSLVNKLLQHRATKEQIDRQGD